MKRLYLSLSALAAIFFFFNSCKKDELDGNNAQNAVVSQFVYDGMSTYYLWANAMKDIKPSSTSEPLTYFESILNATDKKQGWSWITDDVQALLAEFAGTPKDFGFDLMLLWTDSKMKTLVGIVKYVYPNTPASEAGITRGDIFTKINNQDITLSNYEALFGVSAITITFTNQHSSNVREVTVTPREIETDPVLYHQVYETQGHKIAYLFYTGFISNYNNRLYQVFSEFKEQDVTDIILDLRYNHGGSVTAASYLSSLIAPKADVENKSVLVKMSYNSFLNEYFDTEGYSRTDNLGEYDSKSEQNPLNANLNLSSNTVYIIATGDSYSASELITYCLRNYMNVVHVGEETGGKYTASITIHGYDESVGATVYDENSLSKIEKNSLENWAMQPIIAEYTNKNSTSFANPGYLTPDYPIESLENNPSAWRPIGDTTDYLLANTISIITTGKPMSISRQSAPKSSKIPANLFSKKDNLKKESVILNNFKLSATDAENIRQQMKLR